MPQAHIYQRFLNRIVTNDLTRHVLPLRTQSITGARMLNFLNYTVDAIYLDGAQVTRPLLLACQRCLKESTV